MMRRSRDIVRVALVTIELRTPLSIGEGGGIDREDAPIVRDAHGLPFLPGTSLAGVLRAAYAARDGQETEDLFGESRGDEGRASRLEVSNGYVHGSDDLCAIRPGLSVQDGMAEDDLLRWYQHACRTTPLKRRRTRISARGVAEDGALFDRTIVPRGTRFTFELALWDEADASDHIWRELGACLFAHRFRLGAATRSGLGAIEVARCWTGCFDLRRDFDAYWDVFGTLQRLRTPETPTDGVWHGLEVQAHQHSIIGTLDDFWRVGSGETALTVPSDRAHEDADLVPLVEPVISWRDGVGRRTEALVVPGAGLKGALRHRTAFHDDRLSGRLLDPEAPGDDAGIDLHPAIVDLFGVVREAPRPAIEGMERTRQPAIMTRGRVVIDDAFVPVDGGTVARTVMHNSIDRFTGGVRHGALFGEQMVWKGSLAFGITILPGDDPDAERHERAFGMALDDLTAGRLPIGAAGNRGNGRFTGLVGES